MREHFKYIITVFVFLHISILATSQSFYVEYNDACRSIYKDIIDLKINSAKAKLIQIEKSEPQNLARIHLDNYVDFFELFINEDLKQFKLLRKNKDLRLKILEKSLANDDPYKKFVLAEINLQWAVSRSKFDELFKAAREVFAAYNLLKENAREHPDFIYNKKSLSIIHSLIETITIPGIFKKIFGIKGSIALGLNEIEQVLEYSYSENFIFNEEADAIYSFILFFQCNKKEKAWKFIQESRLNPKESLLATFLVCKIAQRSGLNEEAISILHHRPEGDEYMPFYYLDLLEGISQLRKLDPNCREKIDFYINNFDGQHYIKEANQKMAWASLVFDEDIIKYKYYMSQVKDRGVALLDDDKQALKESVNRSIPDPTILKSRLLYDGGYYEPAHRLLTKMAHRYMHQGQFSLEFNYRIGRTAQALKNYPEAIMYLSNTLNNGYHAEEYYACNAALQIGAIYESQNNLELALKYYKTCLKLSPKEYKNSIHQKAKTGINRLENR